MRASCKVEWWFRAHLNVRESYDPTRDWWQGAESASRRVHLREGRTKPVHAVYNGEITACMPRPSLTPRVRGTFASAPDFPAYTAISLDISPTSPAAADLKTGPEHAQPRPSIETTLIGIHLGVEWQVWVPGQNIAFWRCPKAKSYRFPYTSTAPRRHLQSQHSTRPPPTLPYSSMAPTQMANQRKMSRRKTPTAILWSGGSASLVLSPSLAARRELRHLHGRGQWWMDRHRLSSMAKGSLPEPTRSLSSCSLLQTGGRQGRHRTEGSPGRAMLR